MFKKERINNFKILVDSYKEIDRKIVDIKVAMHDLEKLSYNEDIDFLENLEKQLDNMKHTNICIIGVPEGEEREKETEYSKR